MNTRERFLEVLNFNKDIRTLDWEFGYWGGALNRWYEEGLIKIEGLEREVTYGEGVCGPGLHWPEPSFSGDILRDKDVYNYFNFDEGIELIPYNYWIYPKFEKRVIKEDDDKIELVDIDGIRKRILKDDSSIPFYLEWPVRNMKDWEGFKEERLNLNTIKQRFVGDREKFLETVSHAIALDSKMVRYPCILILIGINTSSNKVSAGIGSNRTLLIA